MKITVDVDCIGSVRVEGLLIFSAVRTIKLLGSISLSSGFAANTLTILTGHRLVILDNTR